MQRAEPCAILLDKSMVGDQMRSKSKFGILN
jgi:hypothetical protein